MNDHPEMTPVDEQAAFWLFRTDIGLSPEEEVEFAAWLSASEDHLHVWERGLGALDGIGLDDDPLIDAMRTDALTARPAASSRIWRAMAAVAAVLVLGLVGLTSWQALSPSSVTPGGGGTQIAANHLPDLVSGDTQRRVTLPDGSIVTLDRQTALAMNYGPQRRDIQLLRGRAIFDVKHDGRSFAVVAGDVTVTDMGTRFSVQLRSDGVVANLERGRVVVSRMGDPVTAALVPGQSLTALSGKPFSILSANPATMFDWSVFYVEFHDTPLDQAVAQLNKHSVTQLRVIGAAARLRVSGRFRVDDPDGFVLAVTQILAVKRHVGRDGVVELVARR